MSDIPTLGPAAKLTTLYGNFKTAAHVLNAKFIYGKSCDKVERPHEEVLRLDPFLDGADNYVAFAQSVQSMSYNLSQFRKNLDSTIEIATQRIRGVMSGVTASTNTHDGAILGVFPYEGSGQSAGVFSGDLQATVSEIFRTPVVVQSSRSWLNAFIAQYVGEMNAAAGNLEITREDARLKLNVDRVNAAIADCYAQNDVLSLRAAIVNLEQGVESLEAKFFPSIERGGVFDTRPSLAEKAETFVAGAQKVRAFVQGKQRISFYYGSGDVYRLEDKTPAPPSTVRLFHPSTWPIFAGARSSDHVDSEN